MDERLVEVDEGLGGFDESLVEVDERFAELDEPLVDSDELLNAFFDNREWTAAAEPKAAAVYLFFD